MSTYEDREQDARDDAPYQRNCIGCHLGICTDSHDDDTEDDE